MNVDAVAIAIAELFAEFGHERGTGENLMARDAFGHEENAVWRKWRKFGKQGVDFLEIDGGGDDEFELDLIFMDPPGEDIGLQASGLVALDPGFPDGAAGRGGMPELGADGGQITGDSPGRNGSGGLEGDVPVTALQFGREVVDPRSHHGFSAGEHGMPGGAGK